MFQFASVLCRNILGYTSLDELPGEKLVLFKKQEPRDTELDDLLHSLSRTQREIEQAYNRFNFASDPDLVESYVYEISSLQCRYNYLLRRVKERGGCAAAHTLPGKEL